MTLSRDAARQLVVAAVGLDRRPSRRATKASVLAAIRRMHFLQIDTISVVARSPYLVLFSRLGDFEPRWLDEHLAEGMLFEYWAHEACFIPIEDYPLFRGRMMDMGWRRINGWHRWVENHREGVDAVREHIRRNGEVRSAELGVSNGASGGWWDRKFEKHALEMLFDTGELMIARRQSFQRVYDLRERVHPTWDDRHLPSPDVVERALALQAVHALGVASVAWTADFYRRKQADVQRVLTSLAADGELHTATVDGLRGTFYIHPDNMTKARRALRGAAVPTLTTLLSPFDPLVRDRSLAHTLFDFEYRIECYTPAPKRVYGYFSLPILRRGELIGRLDAKSHRKEGVFEIRSLHLEKGVVVDDVASDVRTAIDECALWHRTPHVTFAKGIRHARAFRA